MTFKCVTEINVSLYLEVKRDCINFRAVVENTQRTHLKNVPT